MVLEAKSGRGRAQEARAALAEKGTLEGRRVLTWFSRLPGNGWDGLSAGFDNLGSPVLCADRTFQKDLRALARETLDDLVRFVFVGRLGYGVIVRARNLRDARSEQKRARSARGGFSE